MEPVEARRAASLARAAGLSARALEKARRAARELGGRRAEIAGALAEEIQARLSGDAAAQRLALKKLYDTVVGPGAWEEGLGVLTERRPEYRGVSLPPAPAMPDLGPQWWDWTGWYGTPYCRGDPGCWSRAPHLPLMEKVPPRLHPGLKPLDALPMLVDEALEILEGDAAWALRAELGPSVSEAKRGRLDEESPLLPVSGAAALSGIDSSRLVYEGGLAFIVSAAALPSPENRAYLAARLEPPGEEATLLESPVGDARRAFVEGLRRGGADPGPGEELEEALEAALLLAPAMQGPRRSVEKNAAAGLEDRVYTLGYVAARALALGARPPPGRGRRRRLSETILYYAEKSILLGAPPAAPGTLADAAPLLPEANRDYWPAAPPNHDMLLHEEAYPLGDLYLQPGLSGLHLQRRAVLVYGWGIREAEESGLLPGDPEHPARKLLEKASRGWRVREDEPFYRHHAQGMFGRRHDVFRAADPRYATRRLPPPTPSSAELIPAASCPDDHSGFCRPRAERAARLLDEAAGRAAGLPLWARARILRRLLDREMDEARRRALEENVGRASRWLRRLARELPEHLALDVVVHRENWAATLVSAALAQAPRPGPSVCAPLYCEHSKPGPKPRSLDEARRRTSRLLGEARATGITTGDGLDALLANALASETHHLPPGLLTAARVAHARAHLLGEEWVRAQLEIAARLGPPQPDKTREYYREAARQLRRYEEETRAAVEEALRTVERFARGRRTDPVVRLRVDPDRLQDLRRTLLVERNLWAYAYESLASGQPRGLYAVPLSPDAILRPYAGEAELGARLLSEAAASGSTGILHEAARAADAWARIQSPEGDWAYALPHLLASIPTAPDWKRRGAELLEEKRGLAYAIRYGSILAALDTLYQLSSREIIYNREGAYEFKIRPEMESSLLSECSEERVCWGRDIILADKEFLELIPAWYTYLLGFSYPRALEASMRSGCTPLCLRYSRILGLKHENTRYRDVAYLEPPWPHDLAENKSLKELLEPVVEEALKNNISLVEAAKRLGLGRAGRPHGR